jgi:hypothetical protein
MTTTAKLTVSLYALFVAGCALTWASPASCPLPAWNTGVKSFTLYSLIACGFAVHLVWNVSRGRKFVLKPGWLSQAIVWPLLMLGIVGVGLAAGCQQLELQWPTLDVFAQFSFGSIWNLRANIGETAGIVGAVLFQFCTRKVPKA